MKTLEVLFRGGPTSLTVRTGLNLPDAAPDVPLELRNPLGFGATWRRVSEDHERPAIYTRLEQPTR